MISLTSSVVCTGKSCRYNDVINTSLSFWLEVILVIIMFIGLPQLPSFVQTCCLWIIYYTLKMGISIELCFDNNYNTYFLISYILCIV